MAYINCWSDLALVIINPCSSPLTLPGITPSTMLTRCRRWNHWWTPEHHPQQQRSPTTLARTNMNFASSISLVWSCVVGVHDFLLEAKTFCSGACQHPATFWNHSFKSFWGQIRLRTLKIELWNGQSNKQPTLPIVGEISMHGVNHCQKHVYSWRLPASRCGLESLAPRTLTAWMSSAAEAEQ